MMMWSIMYLYELRKGYWAHDGKVTIFDAFNKLRNNYNDIMQRCRKLDETIYDDKLSKPAEKSMLKFAAELIVRQFPPINFSPTIKVVCCFSQKKTTVMAV